MSLASFLDSILGRRSKNINSLTLQNTPSLMLFTYLHTRSRENPNSFIEIHSLRFMFFPIIFCIFDTKSLNIGFYSNQSLFHIQFFHGSFYRFFLCNFSHYSPTTIFTEKDFETNHLKIYENYLLIP